MRTYRIEKKSRFFQGGSRNERRFNFFEFISSGDGTSTTTLPGPDWIDDGYFDSMKCADGSYGLSQKTVNEKDGTCYAVCAIKALGREPPKDALDHIERLKKDDGSFRLGPHKTYSDIDTTFNAVLALSACKRPVPKESAAYAKSCRNSSGNYGVDAGFKSNSLIWTWEALFVLKAAGHDISDEEKAQTENYVLSKLDKERDIETCYGALVSLDLMGSGLGPRKKKIIREQFENKSATTCSSYEEKFKLLVIKQLIGSKNMPEAAELNGPSPAPPRSMKEAYYAVLARKLSAGVGGQK